MIKKLIFVIFIISYGNTLYSQYIGNIFTFNIKKNYVFLVDKSQKELLIVKIKNDNINNIKTFKNILTGEKQGDKFKKGDKKTPEGIYKIVKFIPPSKLDRKYGDGAYPLSYPNPVDKILGKTGGGIWIHGLLKGIKKTFTKGCVALHNGNLKELSQFSPVGKYIVISRHVNYLNLSEYMKEREFWIKYFTDFINSWEKNNFNKFKGYFHPYFKNSRGNKLKNFLMTKKKLMSRYPYKKIYFDRLQILKDDNKEVFIKFRQLYCANNLFDEGNKELYLLNNNGRFKIIYEDYNSDNSLKLTKKFISKFLHKWIQAWESKNISQYISFYSDKFKSKRFSKYSWKKYKSKIFKKYKKINIKIANLKFKILNPLTTEVFFLQKFRGNNYKDIGIKKIILYGCPGDYKIIREFWRKIK